MSTNEKSDHHDVIVVGAGMAGLTAAKHIQKAGYQCLILESDSQVGGRIRTIQHNSIDIEVGAAFISDFYQDTLAEIADAGMSDALRSRSQHAYLARGGQPRPLWPAVKLLKGSALSVQAKLRTLLLAYDLITSWGKLNIANLRPAVDLDSLSAYELATKRIGAESRDFFLSPLLRGLLYWDMRNTSAPVLLAILKSFLGSKATYRLDGGLQRLPDRLAAELHIRKDSIVTEISNIQDAGTIRVKYITNGDRFTATTDQVVLATPAPVAASLIHDLPAGARKFLIGVEYSRCSVLTFQTQGATMMQPPGALLFPPCESPDLYSINPVHGDSLEDGRANVFNVYRSNSSVQDGGARKGGDLEETVRADILRRAPYATQARSASLINVQNWDYAIPNFNKGYVQQLMQFKDRAAPMPRVAFAGDYLGGPYVDGAVRSGREAAAHILSTRDKLEFVARA